MQDLFENVWGDQSEVVVDHCVDITLPVSWCLGLLLLLARTHTQLETLTYFESLIDAPPPTDSPVCDRRRRLRAAYNVAPRRDSPARAPYGVQGEFEFNARAHASQTDATACRMPFTWYRQTCSIDSSSQSGCSTSVPRRTCGILRCLSTN